jgi:hypothetical protein
MANNRVLIIGLIIMIPLALAGQSDYRDVSDAITRLITVQENCIGALKNARKSDEVVTAMKDLGGGIRDLNTLFADLEKKHPLLFADDRKIPPEIRVLMATSEKASRRLSEITLISLYRYGAEPEVGTEMERLREMLKSFMTRTAR